MFVLFKRIDLHAIPKDWSPRVTTTCKNVYDVTFLHVAAALYDKDCKVINNPILLFHTNILKPKTCF